MLYAAWVGGGGGSIELRVEGSCSVHRGARISVSTCGPIKASDLY